MSGGQAVRAPGPAGSASSIALASSRSPSAKTSSILLIALVGSGPVSAICRSAKCATASLFRAAEAASIKFHEEGGVVSLHVRLRHRA
jgi:hypothetical protein